MFFRSAKGFTLVEIMIVVAIIGVLAAIAIPQYQNHVARAQVSEAVYLLDALKSPVVESVGNSGIGACSAFISSGSGAVPDSLSGFSLSGKYVESIVFSIQASTFCRVRASYRANAVSFLVAGKFVDFVYSAASGEWRCVSNLESRIRPVGCEEGS